MRNRVFLLLIIFVAISACKEVEAIELLLIKGKGMLRNEIGEILVDGSCHKFNAERADTIYSGKLRRGLF